ncbi:MAG: hypothetical protein EZS28_006766 [Streblomastix strix]|uniref:Uncharacterized protein n=1 Tax=Streblomastix strix TaxID=222440 RepID=A0A5J4WRF7_9EUKA|nr:MAG: hypothetical protein EZS28_006766 [Streblomastix strix]
MGDLLLGPDLLDCPEKKYVPQLYYYIKTAKDYILRTIDINDRILGFRNNDEIDESNDDYEYVEEEEEEEEQRQKQDQSGEFQPYRDMDFDVQIEESAIRMKTRSAFLSKGARAQWESIELTSGDATILDFALRILSTGASEAPYERMVSRARILLDNRRWNTLPETLQGIIVVAESN